jgi:hypothetical protein
MWSGRNTVAWNVQTTLFENWGIGGSNYQNYLAAHHLVEVLRRRSRCGSVSATRAEQLYIMEPTLQLNSQGNSQSRASSRCHVTTVTDIVPPKLHSSGLIFQTCRGAEP